MPRDKVSIDRINLLHPAIKCLVTNAIDKAEAGLSKNMAIRIVQGMRTIEEQNGLYALGRTKRNPDGATSRKPLGNIVTNAKGGQSIHNYGLAVDFCFIIDKDNNGIFESISWDMTLDMDKDGKLDWNEVVAAFEFYGFSWGGKWRTFKDYPHFDVAGTKSYKWYLERFNNKIFIPGTKWVRLD